MQNYEKHILVSKNVKDGYGKLIVKDTSWNDGMNKILKYIEKNKEDFLKFRDA